jgi:hypothetical protein
MNTKFFSSLSNRTVSDLYWLLFQKSPIASCPDGFNFPLFPDEIIIDLEANSYTYFEQLDAAPEEIEHFVDRKKNYRLGFYAEALLSFYFQTNTAIELIIQNLQIMEDKKTIGEVDFLVKWKHRLLHIELAVKYYLLIPSADPEQAENWIGPSKKDNLGKKLLKVQNAQLNLFKYPSALEKIPAAYDQKIESFFMLRGQFFSHKEQFCSFANQNRCIRPFYFENDSVLKNKTIKQVLTRPNWLSSLDKRNNLIALKGLNQKIIKPTLVKFESDSVGFILPESWKEQP